MERPIKPIKKFKYNPFKFFQTFKKKLKKRTLSCFEINLVEHCNLKCAYCTHFAPLAEEYYYDVVVFEKDIKRISELTSTDLSTIRLLGGEPLLHPKLNDILKITRNYFPNTEIILVTNGILLLKKDTDFFETCKKNDIIIECTKYPIEVDYKEIKRFLLDNNIKFRFARKTEIMQAKFVKYPLKRKGDISFFHSYIPCIFYQDITLRNGKIYQCPIVANIHILNKYFNTNFKISEKDYVDIHSIDSIEEVHSFINKKVPFCRYCDIFEIELRDWTFSKKEISEWIID